MHSTAKAVMGAAGYSGAVIESEKGEIEAGLLAHKKSDGTVTILKADGAAIGISMGKDLSNAGYSPICKRGSKVPVQLTAGFDPTIGAQVAISDTTGKAKAYTGTGDTYINATYVTSRVGGTGVDGGIDESGTLDGCAYISFPGGV